MKLTREKAALGVFVALILAGLGVLLFYIFTVGHSLNVAASSIDDATGSLDGYTAILYKGTAEEHSDNVVDTSSIEGRLSVRNLNLSSTQKGGRGAGDEVSASDAAGSTTSGEASHPLTTFSLAVSYLDKQARTFELDVEHPTLYNERTVIQAGRHTFGILSIDAVTAQPGYLDKRVAAYRAEGVDVVVALVSDLSLLKDYEGCDIVISLVDEGLADTGALVDGIFYDDTPLVGQVGTILVSPSRTITAKDAQSR